MKNLKFWRTALVATLVLTVMLSVTGGTIAWFTDTVASKTNVIQSGTLDLDVFYSKDGNEPWTELDENGPALFEYDKWEPGYVQTKAVRLENNGTLALKYELMFQPTQDTSKDKFRLEDVIDVYMSDTAFTRDSLKTAKPVATLAELMYSDDEDGAVHGEMKAGVESKVVYIALKMQESAGNEYQGLSVGKGFGLKIVATQLASEEDSFGPDYDEDAAFVDAWDGTADTDWYNEEATSFYISTAEELAGFGQLVNEGNSFEGKTVNLVADLDLYYWDDDPEWDWYVNHEPIGNCQNAFKGTFDGNGHSIDNMFQSGYVWGNTVNAIGLFGHVENATIKNITLSKALTYGEVGDFGGIAGHAFGDCTFENITVEDSTIAGYNNGSGGIVGEAGAGTYTFKNITLTADTSVGTTNRSFDTAIGGVIGQLSADATVTFEDMNVACVIDAYNDVCANQQWYTYRRCGMLIGAVPKFQEMDNKPGNYIPDPVANGVTCKNVTVTFGDWANYTYCADGGKGARYARIEAGYQYAGIDITACTDIDEHLELPFDELFGCTTDVTGGNYGISEYAGVKVITN